MPDNQNKGIGRYKDRPGYFMGGMIGGAILGALVNKVQGKDWKRGALFGGLTGGITGGWGGEGGLFGAKTGWLGTEAGKSWLGSDVAKRGLFKGMLGKVAPLLANKGVQAGLGAGAAYMMGDPAYDARKQREEMEWLEEERRRKNLAQYPGWYDDPWADWNTGGIVNARKGYYNGGGAWSGAASDEEVLGSEQDRILSITGQGGIEGQEGLEDITETFEMSSGPGQGDLSGWHEMYLDLQGKGELPDWMDSFEIFMQNLDVLDISPWDFAKASPQTQGRFPLVGGSNANAQTQGRFPLVGGEMAAQGGYKKKPQYKGGGIEDLDMTGGGASYGPGTGTSDDIPAMLSDGEFVVTANAVKNLGGGDRMLGARKMYQMMNQLDPASQTPSEMSTVGIA